MRLTLGSSGAAIALADRHAPARATAIMKNGHTISMQKVARSCAAEIAVTLHWVSLQKTFCARRPGSTLQPKLPATAIGDIIPVAINPELAQSFDTKTGQRSKT